MVSMTESVYSGMARAFHVCTWADAQEEKGRTFPGVDLMDEAPKTTRRARDAALLFSGRLEHANGMQIVCLLYAAVKADGFDPYDDPSCIAEEYARDFGHYLAMQGMGHGVGWFDDHAKFALVIPHYEYAF